VRSCIFWGNGGEQIYVSGSVVDVDYSDIDGGRLGIAVGNGQVLYGNANLNLDPLFVNAPVGNYHLQATSPCIDAGDPGYLPFPGETDIDGQARRQGAAVEMGADEVR
jgi:hypothetical protein